MTDYEKKSLALLEGILALQNKLIEMISVLPEGTGNDIRAKSAKRVARKTARNVKKASPKK